MRHNIKSVEKFQIFGKQTKLPTQVKIKVRREQAVKELWNWLEKNKKRSMIVYIEDIIIKVLMISGELIELICDFRRTETEQNFQFLTPLPITELLYNSFLQTLLEVKNLFGDFHPIFPFSSSFQAAEYIGLQNTTKFMAKKYLDIFLSSQNQINIDRIVLISLTCLRIAAKFNQTLDQSLLASTQYCIQISGGKYTQQQFLNCETEIIALLNFSFRFTTPYDYLVVKNLLPPEKKILALLESVIDFSITMIEMRNSSAEEIFFGCLLYCCQEKQASEICYTIIEATTYKWRQAQQVAKSLDKKLRHLLQQ